MRKLLLLSVAGLALSGCQTAPSALTGADIAANVDSLKTSLSDGQEPVSQAITLYEAMARALKYNLDHRVSMMEIDLAQRDYDLSSYKLLPKIVASGGYYGRNNEPGASSRSLLSGRQSLEPSTSTERDVFSGDLTASWNILDFGLSKIRAKQLGDDVLILEERRRKAVIDIMEDVHRAYWRAISAERLDRRLGQLESDVRQAFDSSRQLYMARKTAPMPALSYQRELNEIQAQAQRMKRELSLAKMELASLMGLPASQSYRLKMPTHTPRPKRLAQNLDQMIDTALAQRPEIREAAYRVRIGEGDIKAATLEMFPSLEAFAGVNASTNDFLFNKDWVSYGAKASWNLLQLIETPVRKRKAHARVALERERGLATAMAVMTQVSVARARYAFLSTEYDTASQGTQVQSDILSQVEALARASSASRQTLVREQMNAILAEVRRDALHAEMQEAMASVYTAMGYDPYGVDINGQEDVATIATSLETLWNSRASQPAS